MKNKVTFVLLWITALTGALAQCPTTSLYDGTFMPSANPVWMNCINLATAPDSFQITFGSPNDMETYSLDFGDGSAAATGSTWPAGTFINHTFQNLGTYTVTLIQTANGCSDTLTGTVINERTPTAGINGPPVGQNAGCAPHQVCFGNNSYNVTESTVFTWNFGDGTTQTFDYTNAGQTVCHTYQREAADCGITVELTAQNNCGASTTTWNPVDIFDIDEAQITPGNSLLCYPDTTVTFTNTSNLNCISGTRYIYWDFGDGTTYGWTTINTPITHSFPGVGTYTIMMVDSNACGPDTAYATVTITNPPTAGVSASADTICAGQSVNFQNLSSGGNEYTWNFGDGTTNTVNSTNAVNHTFQNPGDYTISLTADITNASGACAQTAYTDVVLLAAPIANFQPNAHQACDSLTVMFTNLTVGAAAWSWDFGNGNTDTIASPSPQQYSGAGTYTATLSVTSANGCTGSTQQDIDIFESPQAAFSVQQACANDTAQFTDQSSIGNDSIISWNWNFGNGTSTAQHPSSVYANPGTQSVKLIVQTAYCSDTIQQNITIDSLPIAAFTPDTTEGCTDLEVFFTNQSAGASLYTWNVDGIPTSSGNSFSHIFTNSGSLQDSIYNVQLMAETQNGCADDTSLTITVHPLPVADFSTNALPQCSPLEATFTNTSSNYVSSYWTFDDGNSSISNSPTNTFINDSIFIRHYQVQLIVESLHGCRDTTGNAVTVYPRPQFEIQGDSGCAPLDMQFSTNAGGVSYIWDFGDGNFATGVSPQHTYTNTTFQDRDYTVQMIATTAFNCVDTATAQVKVYSNPKADFFITPASQVYPQAAIKFHNISKNADTYTWHMGDGTTYTGFEPDSHQFAQHGQYNVLLIAENTFCTDTATYHTVVNPATPVADFELKAEGCRPLTISVSNTSVYADNYMWDFGDGGTSTQENPNYTYYTPGTYTVSLVATGAGGQTLLQRDSVVVVHQLPEAAFTANPKLVHLPDEAVNFYNLSTYATNYFWDFGDGNVSYEEYPEYTYKDLGEFTVTLIAQNEFGCADTTTEVITTIAGGKVTIPNAFTPDPLGGNGGYIGAGGMNDVFYPITEGVNTFNLKIFNRWGELLFESNDPQIGWDGYYRNELCKQDVYVYRLHIRFENGETVEKVGDITLLR